MPLDCVTVPCLADNYAFLLHDAATGDTAVVDVPDAAAVQAALAARGWRLASILLTHHHDDHIQGVDALRAATGARVAGNGADAARLPRLDRALAPGDRVRVGGAEGVVLAVPGHTRGHIAFHFPGAELVCTGDSLMAGGCGRLFEGTAEEMWQSLATLAALPPATRVASGHEYTASNLRFAASLEPDNAALMSRISRVAALRAEGRPTVPSLLSDEIATNPFLRAPLAGMKRRLGLDGAPDAAVFAELRARKDRFPAAPSSL